MAPMPTLNPQPCGHSAKVLGTQTQPSEPVQCLNGCDVGFRAEGLGLRGLGQSVGPRV